jgi:glycosyltransferase involved in cell wall biosynthesis
MPVSSPAVTIIVPTYNSSGTLRSTLESILRQEFGDYEVWIVGDGCTDDSEAVISAWGDGRVHWINLPVNSGRPAGPRNEALRRARGRWIAYLGHDDLWFPWHLGELIRCIENSRSDFAYSLAAIVGPKGIVETFGLPRRPWNSRENISPSNWLHERRMIEMVGDWSPRVKMGDDRDFLKRVKGAGQRIAFSRQLSVLKYPAGLWQTYARALPHPQTEMIGLMKTDPEALRLRLLHEIAGIAARRSISEPGYGILKKKFFGFMKFIADAYGRNRWPLNLFFYWHWRRRVGLSGGGKRGKKQKRGC